MTCRSIPTILLLFRAFMEGSEEVHSVHMETRSTCNYFKITHANMISSRTEKIVSLALNRGENSENQKYFLRKRNQVNYKSLCSEEEENASKDSNRTSNDYSISSLNFSTSEIDESELDSICSESEQASEGSDVVIPLAARIIFEISLPCGKQFESKEGGAFKIFRNQMCNVGLPSISRPVVGGNNKITEPPQNDLLYGSLENTNAIQEILNNSDHKMDETEVERSETISSEDDRYSRCNNVTSTIDVNYTGKGVLVDSANILKLGVDKESVEIAETSRPWLKKSCCPFCFKQITHFGRHLQKNHSKEGAVRKFLAIPPTDKQRKILLGALTKQGNYLYSDQLKIIRPVRRPNPKLCGNYENVNETFVICPDCFGYFKKNYLRRHRTLCKMRRSKKKTGRENHLAASQIKVVCSGYYEQFYNNLRLKKEVLEIMRADNISKAAQSDILICLYAEDRLGMHKRTQIRSTISNKMRELGRILIELQSTTGIKKMLDALKPEYFDALVGATKLISGYEAQSKTFAASSLAVHMGTTLKQICDTATEHIIKKSPFISCTHPEETLKSIKRLRSLIEKNWNSKLASLALKNLNEQKWEKPKLFPLTSDAIKFRNYIECIARKSSVNLQAMATKEEFRTLSECVLALTILLNRKRISEVQYLTVPSYNADNTDTQYEEFLHSLTETEKFLCKTFRRVVTGGKGSKPVAILFPKSTQEYIELLLRVRNLFVPEDNHFLFANPTSSIASISGYHTLKKLAREAGVSNQHLFTSTRLRKHIATVIQIMNISENELEQFAGFMGHTKKTHSSFYRLPQGVYETAKISKLLSAVNKGKGAEYKGKSLDDIEFSDNVETDSDEELNNFSESFDVPNTYNSSGRENNKDNERTEAVSLNVPAKKVIRRDRWTDNLKKIALKYFKGHIQKKKTLRRTETEIFLEKYKEIFRGKSWEKIKAYIYNYSRKFEKA